MWQIVVVFLISGVFAGCSGQGIKLKPYVRVNGALLNTKNAKGTDSIDSYGAYEFFDGVAVKFTCHIKTIPSLLELSSNAHGNIEMKPTVILNTTSEVFLYIKLSRDNNGNFIDCRAADFKNTRSFVTRINLKLRKGQGSPGHDLIPLPERCTTLEDFISRKTTCAYGTVIEGLAKEKVLGKFIRNIHTITVLYEYYDDETLSLICETSEASDTSQPEWSYNDSQVEVNYVNPNVSYASVTKGHKKFKLKPNETRVTIACISKNEAYQIKTTDIILIRKKHIENPPESSRNEFSAGTETISLTDSSVPYQGESNGNEGLSKEVIMIIGGCGLVFIIVIAFIIIQLFKRKPVPSNPDSNINYENLQNTGATPAPSQWREAQYSAPLDRIANNDYAVPYKPSLGEMYATPLPKSQRHEKDNPAYASVDDLNATYAQAVPKPLRGVPVLPTNRESTYAELALKPKIAMKPNSKNKEKFTQEESPYAEITPSESSYTNSESPFEEMRIESPYAEVASSESSYADPNNLTKNYVNVFKDPRYVNAEGKSDYAEPAYCEINKIHK